MEEARKLATEIFTDLAKSTASFLAKKAKDYVVDISNKDQIDIGEAYEDYLNRVYETYSKSKSLVYVDEEKDISSFFEPVDLAINSTMLLSSSKGRDQLNRVSTQEITEVLSIGSKIIIIGSGGTGKTILMKYLCVNSIEALGRIPIFISLRWFNNTSIEDEPFEKLIYNQLNVLGFKLAYKYFLYSLEGDRYLFLFDGYDEIKQDRATIIMHKLSEFTKKYRNNYFIISTRPDDRVIGLDEYKLVSMCPLSPEQIDGLIGKLEVGYDFKSRFLEDIRLTENERYQSFIKIPLLLSILFITYCEKTNLPDSLNQFYEEAFSTLLYRHDRKKEGLVRVLESKLRYDQFRLIFSKFCFSSFFNGDASFSEQRLLEYLNDSAQACGLMINPRWYLRDLEKIACMIIKDGLEYIFIHRSFQEYFAAYYASKGTDDQIRYLIPMLIEDSSFLSIMNPLHFIYLVGNIEPKRVNYLFLWPIVEKIHNIYINNKADLIKTASKIFILHRLDLDDDNDKLYSLQLNDKVFDKKERIILSVLLFSKIPLENSKQMSIEFQFKQQQYIVNTSEPIIPIYDIKNSIPNWATFYYGLKFDTLNILQPRAVTLVNATIETYYHLLPQSKDSKSRYEFLNQY